jgi:hypothetical protein
MRARDYIDDVKLRLMRNDVMNDLDDATIMTFVNWARRKVQHTTMSLVPERYGKIVELTPTEVTEEGLNRYLLPEDCINVYVAYFEYNDEEGGDTTISEMRYVTNREIETTLDHDFNGPTLQYPIYTVYYGISGVFTRDVLEMSYGSYNLSGDIEKIIVYYIAAVNDLEYLQTAVQPLMDDDETVIPAEYDELVVLYAVLYSLQVMQEEVAKTSTEAEIELVVKGLKQEYDKEKARVGMFLPSKKGI